MRLEQFITNACSVGVSPLGVEFGRTVVYKSYNDQEISTGFIYDLIGDQIAETRFFKFVLCLRRRTIRYVWYNCCHQMQGRRLLLRLLRDYPSYPLVPCLWDSSWSARHVPRPSHATHHRCSCRRRTDSIHADLTVFQINSRRTCKRSDSLLGRIVNTTAPTNLLNCILTKKELDYGVK